MGYIIMAAGTFTVFDTFREDLGKAQLHIGSATLMGVICSAGWTPSVTGDLSSTALAFTMTAVAGQMSAGPQILTNVVWSSVGGSVYQFDFDNPVFTYSVVTTSKYFLVYEQTSDRLVGYVDLDTGAATGIDATTLTVNVHADGALTLT